MDKNTKMLLGVGVVAVAGYLVYQQMNKTKSFVTSRTKECKKKGTTLVPIYNSEGYVSSTALVDGCGNTIRTYSGNVTSI